MKSKPGTSSQAELSKISETTKREDKGQNRPVIRWFDDADPNSPFLTAPGRTWTYQEAGNEIRRLMADEPRVLAPALQPESVFEVLAGVLSGGVMILAPHASDTPELDLDGAALVVATSGSTDRPKSVRLTLANLLAAAEASSAHLGNGPADAWLLSMPLHHVAGLSILVRQAHSGGSVFLLPELTPEGVWSAFRGEVTMASLVPTMLHRMLAIEAPAPGAIRTVLVGGGPIPDGLLEDANARGLPVRPTYGLTETFGQVATLRPGAPLARRAHPLPGVDLRIATDGRVEIRGPQVSPGYLGEPDRADPWFPTNDLGELDDDGAVTILGRADTVIVTGGENVAPERIEAELSQHRAVTGSIVVGLADPEWGTKVACVYSGDADPEELSDWLAGRLPGFMMPKQWLRVASVPLTALGKPDRQAASAAMRREAG